jgi:hypothetical protein
MISRRFLVPVCALLALACVPTLIHSYIGATEDDGLRVQAIPATLGGIASTPTRRPSNWAQEIYDSHDWFERNYATATGPVRLFVARSYDAKKLYHHPELGVIRGVDFVRGRPATIRVGNASVPASVLDATSGKGVAAYVLVYDDRFVADPVKFQLETSLRLLVSERKAMTLFLAYDADADAAAPLENSAVASILRAAVSSFNAQAPVRAADAQQR